MSKLCFMVIFMAMIAFARGQNRYCYATDNTPYGFYGTKTPYTHVKPSTEIQSPSGCSAVYVWKIIRHGTRYPTGSDNLRMQPLVEIRDQILDNHRTRNRGELCEQDQRNLENWRYFWDDNNNGKLTPQGRKDMEGLAERLRSKFADVARFFVKDKLTMQTSSPCRCQDSALAHSNKVLQATSSSLDGNNVKINDALLKIESDQKQDDTDHVDKFKNSDTMKNVIHQVSLRLGFDADLSIETIILIYSQCIFEKLLNVDEKSPYCCAFTQDHLKVLEYMDDLDSYYKHGPGDTKNHEKACRVVQDVYEKLDAEHSTDNPSQFGTFLYAQSATIVPLFTKFGLYIDSEPLRHDNYEQLKESRNWRISLTDPMAANMMFVKYSCSNELKVGLYVNEALVKIPGCSEDFCSWNILKEKFNNDFLKGCSQTPSGAAAVSPVKVQLIFVIYFVFLFLNKLSIFLMDGGMFVRGNGIKYEN